MKNIQDGWLVILSSVGPFFHLVRGCTMVTLTEGQHFPTGEGA